MCGGKKQEKATKEPIPEPPPDPAQEPATIEEPKAAATSRVQKDTESKMSESKLIGGQQSIGLMTTRGKKAGMTKGPGGQSMAHKQSMTGKQSTMAGPPQSLALTTARVGTPKAAQQSQVMKNATKR